MQIIPPGVATLSAYLKRYGHQVELFDTTFYQLQEKSFDEQRIEVCQVRPFNFADSGVIYKSKDPRGDFINKIDKFKPDIIAISVTDFTHNVAEKILIGIKQRYPNIFIIMGGIYCTFFSEYAINVPEVDAICIGEGYGALLDLCTCLESGSFDHIKHIKNLWVKERNDIYKNTVRAPIDIDEIPHDDFSIFEEKRFFRPMQGKIIKMVPVWVDLGCPYNCTYCIAPNIRQLYDEQDYKYFRTKSVDHIMNELHEYVDKYQVSYIYFSTETFFARPESHIKELAKRYKEEINLPFWAETRVETITDERAALLKDMNCDRLTIGLESGNEIYRKTMLGKNFTNKQFIECMRILQDNGVKLTINNIVGLPEETREQMFDTINLNREATSSKTDVTLTVSTYVPFGGSNLQKYCLEKGYYDINEYIKMPMGSIHFGTYLKMPHIDPKEVEGIQRTFPMYVKMPEEYYPRIKLAEQFTSEGTEEFAKLRDIYWQKYF
jgi:anaerobic magnesium-protoporphyrin IX monomethyl ester cyclase